MLLRINVSKSFSSYSISVVFTFSVENNIPTEYTFRDPNHHSVVNILRMYKKLIITDRRCYISETLQNAKMS